MFRVGQKVVCVDARDTNSHGLPEIVEGGVYTIRWVGVDDYKLCVRLVEVPRNALAPPFTTPPEFLDWPFYASRFRPVVERKTDISIFTAMLTPSPVSTPDRVLADNGEGL